MQRSRIYAAIIGRVVDLVTKRPLDRAQVRIDAGPDTFEQRRKVRLALFGEDLGRTRTTPDGFFLFLNLPEGTYKLTAHGPLADGRHGPKTVPAVEVKRTAGGRVVPAKLSIELVPTWVLGLVVRDEGPRPVPLVRARVRLEPLGQDAWTDEAGSFQFIGVAPGKRELVLLIGDRAVARTPIELSRGRLTRVEFVVQPG